MPIRSRVINRSENGQQRNSKCSQISLHVTGTFRCEARRFIDDIASEENDGPKEAGRERRRTKSSQEKTKPIFTSYITQELRDNPVRRLRK